MPMPYLQNRHRARLSIPNNATNKIIKITVNYVAFALYILADIGLMRGTSQYLQEILVEELPDVVRHDTQVLAEGRGTVPPR